MRMKRTIKKAISFVLSLSMAIVGSINPVFAETSYGPGDTGAIQVSAAINSTYTIELPATVELKPLSNYADKYNVYFIAGDEKLYGFPTRSEAEDYLNTHYMACYKDDDPEDYWNWVSELTWTDIEDQGYNSEDYNIARMSEKCEVRKELEGSFWFGADYKFYVTGLFLGDTECIAINVHNNYRGGINKVTGIVLKNTADPTKEISGRNDLKEYFFFCSNATNAMTVTCYDEDHDREITQDVSRYGKKLNGNDGSAASRTEGIGTIKIALDDDEITAGNYSGTAEFEWNSFDTDSYLDF